MPAPSTFRTDSEQGTFEEGRRLAASLRSGDIVLLTGSLGAGKTVFVRGIAAGLGLDPNAVHSPSFTIVSEYGPSPSGVKLVHVDLYRIDAAAEIEDLGLADYLEGGHVLAVEWGEKMPDRLRSGAVRVTIDDDGEDSRLLTIAGGVTQSS
jgi:tRNA threonylcarbamoyladenosine biosynthesis protein TsaE